jgi:hypothetical protein
VTTKHDRRGERFKSFGRRYGDDEEEPSAVAFLIRVATESGTIANENKLSHR